MNIWPISYAAIILLLLLSGTIFAFAKSRRFRSVLWGLSAIGGMGALLMAFWVLSYVGLRDRSDVVGQRGVISRQELLINQSQSSNKTDTGKTIELVSPLEVEEAAADRKEPRHPRLFGGGAAWLSVVDQEFDADVYPSARMAAKVVGWKIEKVIAKSIEQAVKAGADPNGTSFSIVQISGNFGSPIGGSVRHPETTLILGDLAEVLRKEYKAAEVLVESAEIEKRLDDRTSISIVVDIPTLTKTAAAWDQKKTEFSGSLRASVKSRYGEFSTTARFVEKPWVNQFSEFLATHPKLQLLQARSYSLATSESAARQQAYREAAKSLLPILRQRLGEYQRAQSRGQLIYFHESDEQLINRLVNEMNLGNHVADRFAQRLSRSYGDVWRETVLIQINTAKLRSHTTQIHASSVARRNQLLSTIGKFVALIVFVCVFYFVLNAATKGYYVWVIRGMMIGAVVVAGFVLLLWS